MVRRPRRKSISGVYHIILRGNNQQTIFEDGRDKRHFIDILKRYRKQNKYRLYAYCLMDNHIHFLMEERGDTISAALKRINVSYVRWYNAKYDRCGHLYQDRFKSVVVENVNSFLIVLRYIHQNPWKAGIARDIYSNPWTSIHEYLHSSTFIDTKEVLHHFTEIKEGDPVSSFRTYMEEKVEDYDWNEPSSYLMTDEEVIELIRDMGIPSVHSFHKMERDERNGILAQIKSIDRISIRQLSRITGVSKSVIDRVK
ncbi:transposase [Halobacillus fulvus]|nr:transposase [Halobacillus fulvus]